MHENFSVVDLFCGVGGLSQGFLKEGFRVSAGVDFDKSCEYAFEQNNNARFFHRDLTALTGAELESYFEDGKRKILVGCAPCQPFSIYNSQTTKRDGVKKDDSKWRLLYSFAKLIEAVRPEIVSMENVPLLLKFNNGEVFTDFVKSLTDLGYFVSWYIVDAQNFGVPQRRKRLILFGSRHSKIKLLESDDKKVCVKDAIGHLPWIEDGVAHPSDPLHKARKLTDLNKRRIQATKEGGSWRDWSEELKLDCHKTDAGRLFGSVYGRMKWDDVAPTMTTYCIGLNNGRFGHPEQDRAISLREAALLQSFPETYKFVDPSVPFNSGNIARQIGNAVPVNLGKVIAASIKKHIESIG